MAQTIKLKRSNTAGNLPTTTDLALGEVGINTKDGKFFIRKHVDGTDSGDAITMYAPQGLSTYGTQTLEVKVITKTAAHPQYGTGSASGFSIDGLESPFITLIPGNTYRFDQADSSNTGHPLAFYLEEDKTTSYTTGVTSSGTAGSASAYVEIAVTTDTPQVLYYQCSSHAYMGSGAYALSDAIADGKVDTDQLAANAVTSAKIAANAITSSELAANSVGSTQIAANAVGTAEIAENSVSTSEIASNSITSALIASNAITTSEIAENSVSTSEIASNAITSALIAGDAVGTDEIADNAITSAKIAANAIGSSELASSGVTAASYGSSSAVPVLTIDADGRITAASTQAISGLAANAVTATEIAANAVGSSEIAANAVGSSEIAANAVTSAKIAANAVDTAEIASNAVTSAQLAGNSVSTSEIAANSVGISELNVSDGTNGQVLSTNGSGTLSFVDQSGGSGLSSNAVTSAYIASNAVLSRHIAANAIGASEIASSGVTAGSYTNADITIDADGRISAASNGSSASLADNSVTSAKIAANAVGSSEIASSGVTAGTYGSSTASPQITVDADGRISSVSNVTISNSGGGGGVGLNQTISQYSTTGDGSTTAFNTSITITNENLTWIFIDGVYQQKDSYSTSSSTVTFSAAPPNGTTIEVMVLESITTGGAFGHNSFNGDGSTTDFTLGQTPSADTDLIVFVDGVYQNADSFDISGSDISFDTAPANGTKIIAYVIGGVVTGKVQIVDNFSGDASTTGFTLSLNPVSENNTDVYIDGVYQQKSEYSVSGTTLTFSSAPPSGTNNIEVLIGQVTTTTSMGANSVTSTAIAANAVGSSEIASSAVDTAQIAANAVTAAKIAANAIGSSEIAANAVTDVQIGGNAVTSVHIAANAVGSTEIANNSVGIDELNVSDGTNGQVLTTNGSGTLSFSTISGYTDSDVETYLNTSTIYTDATNNRLGIGTSSPDQPLTVVGSTAIAAKFLGESGPHGLVIGGNDAGFGYIGHVSSGSYDLTLDSSGNVGIGTSTAPAANGGGLAIYKSDYPRITLRNSTSGDTTGDGFQAALVGSDMQWDLAESGSQKFFTGGQERMRITSDGRVGIGITSPIAGAALDVQPYLRAGNLYVGLDNGSRIEGGNGQIYPGVMSFIAGATNMDINHYVVVTGIGINLSAKLDSPTGDWYTNDGSVSSLSDERVKTDITDLSDGLEIVKQLRPVTFKYNDSSEDEDGRKRMGAASDKVRYGFIAQEVEQVAPQYVETGIGYINNEEVDDFKSMSTTRMIPMLFKAIQEQQTIIDDLKARIETLENN